MSLGDLLLGEAVATARERDTASRRDENGKVLALAFATRAKRAESWANELEDALNDAEANYEGAASVIDALVKELSAIDSNNWLLNKDQRGVIFKASYEATLRAREDAKKTN